MARRYLPGCPRHASATPSVSPSPTMSQLGWEAAAAGFTNLASEVDVAACRLHYYLQRLHGLKAQVESVWAPSRLRVSALEAQFRADVEGYLVGVRQDTARLESAQAALRRLLASDASSASGGGSSAGHSPQKTAANLRRASLSPRQPALTTLKEESSRSDSDETSRKDSMSRSKKKQKKSDKCGLDPATLAADLEKKLRGVQRAENEDLDTSAAAGIGDCSARPEGAAAAGSGGSESSSEDSGQGRGSPASNDSGGSSRAEASEDLSILRVELVTPRSVLEEIREHQAALHEHLQLHSQRLQLVAATRRRFDSGGGFRRRRSPPALGQAFEDPRSLQLAVEAAIRELLSAREPLLSRAEALRRLAAAADEARPPPQPQQLRHLPSLRPQPPPQLRDARRRRVFPRLWRALYMWECFDFWASLWDAVSSFCCCACRPRFVEHQQPEYESTWLMRSPPRGYSTTRL